MPNALSIDTFLQADTRRQGDGGQDGIAAQQAGARQIEHTRRQGDGGQDGIEQGDGGQDGIAAQQADAGQIGQGDGGIVGQRRRGQDNLAGERARQHMRLERDNLNLLRESYTQVTRPMRDAVTMLLQTLTVGMPCQQVLWQRLSQSLHGNPPLDDSIAMMRAVSSSNIVAVPAHFMEIIRLTPPTANEDTALNRTLSRLLGEGNSLFDGNRAGVICPHDLGNDGAVLYYIAFLERSVFILGELGDEQLARKLLAFIQREYQAAGLYANDVFEESWSVVRTLVPPCGDDGRASHFSALINASLIFQGLHAEIDTGSYWYTAADIYRLNVDYRITTSILFSHGVGQDTISLPAGEQPAPFGIQARPAVAAQSQATNVGSPVARRSQQPSARQRPGGQVSQRRGRQARQRPARQRQGGQASQRQGRPPAAQPPPVAQPPQVNRLEGTPLYAITPSGTTFECCNNVNRGTVNHAHSLPSMMKLRRQFKLQHTEILLKRTVEYFTREVSVF